MAVIDVYYEITKARLDAQMGQIDQLDAKLATLFGFASAILGIFAGLLTVTALPSNVVAKIIITVIVAIASLVYFWIISCLYKAYQIASWSLRPDYKKLESYTETNSEDEVKGWVADECVRSIDENEAHIKNKAWYIHCAMVALPVEAMLLVVAGLVAMVSK
jgi:hypothetical protein